MAETPEVVTGTTTEPTLDKDSQDFLAYQVAESAKRQVTSWAKWSMGLAVAILAVLGLRTYSDYQKLITSIDERITKQIDAQLQTALDRTLDERATALDSLERRLREQYVDSILTIEQETHRALEDARVSVQSVSEASAKVIRDLESASKSTLDAVETESRNTISAIKRYGDETRSQSQEVRQLFQRVTLEFNDGGVTVAESVRLSEAWSDNERYTLFGEVNHSFLGVTASRPSQQMADAFIEGEYQGAFAYYFVRAFGLPETDLDGNKEVSIDEAVAVATKDMATAGYQQVPVVAGENFSFSLFPLDSMESKPSARALLVGINRYKIQGADLRGCVNDVKKFRDFLINRKIAQPDNVRMITDFQATQSRILKEVEGWLTSPDAVESTLIFFFSGHVTSVRNPNDSARTVILAPTDPDWTKPIEVREIAQLLTRAPAQQKLMIID